MLAQYSSNKQESKASAVESEADMQSDKAKTLSSSKVLEGKLTYVFHLAEDGKMLSFERIFSDFSDKTFLKCVDDQIGQVRFLPPPLGISRYLSYDFSFRDDESFRREQEERKNQPPLQLVVPSSTPAQP